VTSLCNNNNNNNTWDNVYDAVIMTQVISRVHPVYLMNVGQRQSATDPPTRPTNLGCESACRQLYGLHPLSRCSWFLLQKALVRHQIVVFYKFIDKALSNVYFISDIICHYVSVHRLNDIIVSVNGVTTVGVTHAGAVDALKRAGYTVDLVSCSEYFQL